MLAQFKEKTFEKYFGHELARLTKVTFSPDQWDEALLGFDEAFHLPMLILHNLLRAPGRRRRNLPGIELSEIERLGDELSASLPPFKFNLFVQYKRPEYLRSTIAREWASWHKPYFRYETTPHQQDALTQLEQKSQGRAATVYAAAAFWRNEELFSNALAGHVIDRSNVAHVSKFKDHNWFTYCAPGGFGRCHSEPEDVESSPIARIIADGQRQEGMPFSRHIKEMARTIERLMRRRPFSSDFVRARAAVLGENQVGPLEPGSMSLSFALATLEAFSDLMDTSLYAIG